MLAIGFHLQSLENSLAGILQICFYSYGHGLGLFLLLCNLATFSKLQQSKQLCFSSFSADLTHSAFYFSRKSIRLFFHLSHILKYGRELCNIHLSRHNCFGYLIRRSLRGCVSSFWSQTACCLKSGSKLPHSKFLFGHSVSSSHHLHLLDYFHTY